VFAAGVPLSTPAEVSVTPLGSGPVSLNVGAGTPVAVTANDPAVPTLNVVLLALVIAGAWFKLKAAAAPKMLFPVRLAKHVLVPVQPPVPLQPVKADPETAEAVSVVLVFPPYWCVHVPELVPALIVQLMKPSLLVTVPPPVPPPVTVRVGPASVNVVCAWEAEPTAVK